MTFDIDELRELPGVLARRLPGPSDVGDLTDADLTGVLAALGAGRRALDEAAALVAATVARRSTRDLGTDGLAQRRGHKDGAGLVEELAGIGRGEAAKLIRVGGLLETAHSIAPVCAAGADVDPDRDGDDGDEHGTSNGNAEGDGTADTDGATAWQPPPRDIGVLRALPGPWDAPIAVALRNRWVTVAHSDALRTGLGAPARAGRPGGAAHAHASGASGEAAEREQEARWREAAIELIGDCWTGQWNPEDLARAARRMRAALDSAAACAEAQHRYELRSLKRAVRASGMVHYDIELDPESDARFYGPIKRLLSPRFGGPRFTAEPEREAARELEVDPRTNEQLQVDTLVDLIDRAVAADGGELFKTSEPQVMIAVTTAQLAKARDAENRAGRTDAAQGRGCPTPDTGIAWIDGRDEPITGADALRMICSGGYTPALFDETGQAIDVGKDQRLFTRTQRRALVKRDGGCMHPGCDRPPTDCESHHINPWARHPSHRKSEVRDGILLCRRHHKLIHDHGARIERRDGQYWLRWPGREPALLHSKAGVQTQLRVQSANH